jgi:hypothetical protein
VCGQEVVFFLQKSWSKDKKEKSTQRHPQAATLLPLTAREPFLAADFLLAEITHPVNRTIVQHVHHQACTPAVGLMTTSSP